MSDASHPVVTRADLLPRESWDDQARGGVSWFTLFSRDRTPTNALTAGIAEIAAGDGGLKLHQHDQPEIYYIIEGAGLVSIDGVERKVSAGDAVFIPGNALHGARATSAAGLKLFYVFPADRFGDIVYRFPE